MAANRPELLRSRAVVVSVCGKGAPLSASGVGQEGERKRSTDDVSKDIQMTAKPGSPDWPGMSLADACRLARCCPAWRWRELGLGSGAERGNLSPRARGRPVAQQWPAVVRGRETPKRPIREGLSTDAGHRGGPSRSSGEGPVMGLERRGRVVGAGLAVNRLWVGGAG